MTGYQAFYRRVISVEEPNKGHMDQHPEVPGKVDQEQW
jgi:hypothetical protein